MKADDITFLNPAVLLSLLSAIGPLQLGGHVPSNAELESKLFCDDKSNDCLEHHAYVYLKGGYFEFKR